MFRRGGVLFTFIFFFFFMARVTDILVIILMILVLVLVFVFLVRAWRPLSLRFWLLFFFFLQGSLAFPMLSFFLHLHGLRLFMYF